MTQEQKDLLLKDLCARLPYGVVIQEKCVERDKTFLPNKKGDRLVNIDTYTDVLMTSCGGRYHLEEVKPYLFPLSSITKKQMEKLKKLCDMYTPDDDYHPYAYLGIEVLYKHVLNDNYKFNFKMVVIDWFLKNHFDIYGLIPMDLANDVTGLNIY